MSEQEFIFAPPTVTVRFGVRQRDLMLNSLMILDQEDVTFGLGMWVDRTREALSKERAIANKVVFRVLLSGVEEPAEIDEYKAYIDWIEGQDAVAIRDKILNHIVELNREYGTDKMDVSPETLLEDEATYLQVLDQSYGAKYQKKGLAWDNADYKAAYPLLQDPDALKAYMVEHMRYMWKEHLQDEWEKDLPMLRESIEAFQQIDYTGMTGMEAVRFVTGRDFNHIWPEINNATDITFMPSAHIGPYVSYYSAEGMAYVIFGARVPDGVVAKSAALSRSELLNRLNALADDTRLAILELLTHEKELFAQDIMNRLELSQSSASRHLRQLSATGFLIEKRREVAKYYTLNMERFEDTLRALRQFLHTS